MQVIAELFHMPLQNVLVRIELPLIFLYFHSFLWSLKNIIYKLTTYSAPVSSEQSFYMSACAFGMAGAYISWYMRKRFTKAMRRVCAVGVSDPYYLLVYK
ncbi:Uncharacterised protein [Chlamydia trachomatis]|nr:Uncharacterised protein [Chlamydia trachomatis]